MRLSNDGVRSSRVAMIRVRLRRTWTLQSFGRNLIHAELCQDGMSSDKTDSEQMGLQAKIIHHIPKIWINPALSELCNVVKKYGKGSLNRVGNSPHTCIFEPSSSFRTQQNLLAQRQLCVPGLPLNFYCKLWLKGLSPAQQAQVDHKLPRELPPYISHTCLLAVKLLMMHQEHMLVWTPFCHAFHSILPCHSTSALLLSAGHFSNYEQNPRQPNPLHSDWVSETLLGADFLFG